MRRRKVWTEADVQLIKDVYDSGILQGDGKLDSLANTLGVIKSNLCRKARSMGLTLQGRKLTEEAKIKVGLRIKEWLSKNEHPRGFLGGTHSELSKNIMSEMSIAYHENCSIEELNLRIDKMLESRRKNGTWAPAMSGTNMYSRARSGKRKDLDNMFFRSRTEANYARVLKYTKVNFEYEPKTFWFEGIKRGTRAYIPDFYLPDKDEWHEFKGWLDPKSITKLKRMKKYYPEIFPKIRMIMERLTPKVKAQLLEIGFTPSQIVDFVPLNQQYKTIEHWEK